MKTRKEILEKLFELQKEFDQLDKLLEQTAKDEKKKVTKKCQRHQ